jgi:hypothetical protein
MQTTTPRILKPQSIREMESILSEDNLDGKNGRKEVSDNPDEGNKKYQKRNRCSANQ